MPAETIGQSDLSLQRVAVKGRLSVRRLNGKTRLSRLYQEGAINVRMPLTQGEHLEAILINTNTMCRSRRHFQTAPSLSRSRANQTRELNMLELRPNCECCDKDLAPDAPDAMICTFECTFCTACANGVLSGVCPNCGGDFSHRPVRPAAMLKKYPASTRRVLKAEGCGPARNVT